jgi:hypothetical protein
MSGEHPERARIRRAAEEQRRRDADDPRFAKEECGEDSSGDESGADRQYSSLNETYENPWEGSYANQDARET